MGREHRAGQKEKNATHRCSLVGGGAEADDLQSIRVDQAIIRSSAQFGVELEVDLRCPVRPGLFAVDDFHPLVTDLVVEGLIGVDASFAQLPEFGELGDSGLGFTSNWLRVSMGIGGAAMMV